MSFWRSFTLVLFCCASTSASAEWIASVEGPDVFGNTSANVVTSNFREGFAINCDQKGELNIALIFQKKQFEKVPQVPAELLIQVDGATPAKFKAALREWNDVRGGIVASGRSSEAIAILRMIAAARDKINVGAVVNGNQMSASFGVAGSRTAIEKAVKACKIDDASKS